MSEADNENRVRAFYEATAAGHRESLRGLQAPHVIYDLPLGKRERADRAIQIELDIQHVAQYLTRPVVHGLLSKRRGELWRHPNRDFTANKDVFDGI